LIQQHKYPITKMTDESRSCCGVFIQWAVLEIEPVKPDPEPLTEANILEQPQRGHGLPAGLRNQLSRCVVGMGENACHVYLSGKEHPVEQCKGLHAGIIAVR